MASCRRDHLHSASCSGRNAGAAPAEDERKPGNSLRHVRPCFFRSRSRLISRRRRYRVSDNFNAAIGLVQFPVDPGRKNGIACITNTDIRQSAGGGAMKSSDIYPVSFRQILFLPLLLTPCPDKSAAECVKEIAASLTRAPDSAAQGRYACASGLEGNHKPSGPSWFSGKCFPRLCGIRLFPPLYPALPLWRVRGKAG